MEGFLFGAACADNPKSFAKKKHLPFCRTIQFLNLSFPYGRCIIKDSFLLTIFPIPPGICERMHLPKKSLLFPHSPSFPKKSAKPCGAYFL